MRMKLSQAFLLLVLMAASADKVISYAIKLFGSLFHELFVYHLFII